MKHKEPTYIIGISGNSGSGKTTLSENLKKILKATMISWDDFDEVSSGPNDYVDWFKRGCDYSEWDYPKLEQILQRLKSGSDVIHPVSGDQLKNTKYIIFDAPLGRFHEQTGKYIDYWFHLSVPLDISLSRRIIRDFMSDTKTKLDILEELKYYLESSRPLFLDDKYKERADYVIDGMTSIDTQVLNIKKYLGI